MRATIGTRLLAGALVVAAASCLACKGSDDEARHARHRRSGDDDDDESARDRDGATSSVDDFLACPFGLCGRNGASLRAICEKRAQLATASSDGSLSAADRETVIRSCVEAMTAQAKTDPTAYACASDCVMQAKDADAYSRCYVQCVSAPAPPPAPPPTAPNPY